MKNYSEQRGVQSQVIFDTTSGQFIQRLSTHEFEVATKAKIPDPPDASIIEIGKPNAETGAIRLSRKSRYAVMQSVEMKRAG